MGLKGRHGQRAEGPFVEEPLNGEQLVAPSSGRGEPVYHSLVGCSPGKPTERNACGEDWLAAFSLPFPRFA